MRFVQIDISIVIPLFVLIIIAVLICCLIALYLCCVKPKLRWEDHMADFWESPVVHRGLFDKEKHIPENSLKAFQSAVEYGYTIELDVRLSKDLVPVVFHDETLSRMCGDDRKVSDLTADELRQFSLDNEWGCYIPLLTEVLDTVSGQVPLVIEIKTDNRSAHGVRYIAEVLDKYEGMYCIMSFNPDVVAWYRRNRPDIFRGLLSTNWKKEGLAEGWRAFVLTNMLRNYRCRPDFINYDYNYRFHWSFIFVSAVFPFDRVVYTIQTEHDFIWADWFYNGVIVEKSALREQGGKRLK